MQETLMGAYTALTLTDIPTRVAAGVCWDNSVAESAYSTIKNESYHYYSFTTRQGVRRATMQYIEVFYNRWRPHNPTTPTKGYRLPQRWPTSPHKSAAA